MTTTQWIGLTVASYVAGAGTYRWRYRWGRRNGIVVLDRDLARDRLFLEGLEGLITASWKARRLEWEQRQARRKPSAEDEGKPREEKDSSASS